MTVYHPSPSVISSRFIVTTGATGGSGGGGDGGGDTFLLRFLLGSSYNR